ncbi:MAG: transposase [bacterium]
MSKNFVIRWTQSRDQDFTEDNRGWEKGKMRKREKDTTFIILPKKVSSFIGINSAIKKSGKSVNGNGKISKMGNSYVRKMFMMGARTAINSNVGCKAMNERLTAKDKAYRVRMIAVGHKLLRQAFAVAKQGVKYNLDIYNTVMRTS